MSKPLTPEQWLLKCMVEPGIWHSVHSQESPAFFIDVWHGKPLAPDASIGRQTQWCVYATTTGYANCQTPEEWLEALRLTMRNRGLLDDKTHA